MCFNFILRLVEKNEDRNETSREEDETPREDLETIVQKEKCNKGNREVDATRKELARLLAKQKEDFDKLPNFMNQYSHNTPDICEKVKRAKLEEIFKMPEEMIPTMFEKIESKYQPRKFRTTNENPLGFAIFIENESDLDCLNKYEGFKYTDGFGKDLKKVYII